MFVRETEVRAPDGSTYVIRLRRTGVRPYRFDQSVHDVELLFYFLRRRHGWTVEVFVGRVYQLARRSAIICREDCPDRASAAHVAEGLLRALKAGHPLPT
jgi:hypothetical protein